MLLLCNDVDESDAERVGPDNLEEAVKEDGGVGCNDEKLTFKLEVCPYDWPNEDWITVFVANVGDFPANDIGTGAVGSFVVIDGNLFIPFVTICELVMLGLIKKFKSNVMA